MDNNTTNISRTSSLRGHIPTLMGPRPRANSSNLPIISPAPTEPLPPVPTTSLPPPTSSTTPAPQSSTSRLFTAHGNPSLFSIPETRKSRPLDNPRPNPLKSRSLPASPSKPAKPLKPNLPILAPLTQPPDIDFSSKRIPWKGLPLEAAQWTYSSSELREIVARAIRLSAHESFIRLLPLEALDRTLVAESDRLKSLKKATQEKFQFQVQRRTALLQALNSHNIFSIPIDTQKDAFVTIVSSLTSQISEAAASCDKLTQDLLSISDQQAQIAKAKDLHWASALSIALRKLNTSYGRRTNDLLMAQARVQELEAELEDAWREAEAVAKELDQMHPGVSDDGVSLTADLVGTTTEFAEIIGKSLQEEGATVASRRTVDRLGSYSRIEAAKKRSLRVTSASLRQPRTRNARRPLIAQLPHPTMPLPPIPTSSDEPREESYLHLDSMGVANRKRPLSLSHGQPSSLGHKRVVSDGTPKRRLPAAATVDDRSRIPSIWMNADIPKTPDKVPPDTIAPLPMPMPIPIPIPTDESKHAVSEFSKLKLRIKRFSNSVPFGKPSTTTPVPSKIPR